MAREPFFTPTQRGRTQPFQSDRGATADAFGAGLGRAVQGLGQQIERAGQVGARYLAEENALQNESLARDANTAARVKAAELWAEYSVLQGRAAVEAFPKFKQDLINLRKSTLEGLPDGDARRMAAGAMDSWLIGTYEGALTYKTKQDVAWSSESSAAAAAQSIADATLYRQDAEKVFDALGVGAAEVRAQSELMGDAPNVTEFKVRQYLGEGAQTVIMNLAVENPLAAEALFNDMRDELDPVSQLRIAEGLKPKVNDAKADNYVAIVTTGAPGAEAKAAFDYFVADGWTPAQAAGIVGNLLQESGRGLDPTAVGDGGEAYGIAQWRDDRRQALEAFAAERGLDVTARETQLAFVSEELRTTERRAGEALRGATTVKEATAAFAGFERPSGWSLENPQGAHGFDRRLAYAQGFAAPAPGTPVDKKELQRRVYEMTMAAGEDMDVVRLAVTRAGQWADMQNTGMAEEQDRLALVLKDIETGLRAGDMSLTIPETQIRATFPPDDADRIIGDLQMAQLGGSFFATVRFASPEDISGLLADLDSDTGLIPGSIEAAFDIDRSTTEGAARYSAAKVEMRDQLLRAIDDRNKALEADPAAFVAQEPGVLAALQSLQNDRTPQSWATYAATSMAVQERLGVPPSERRVLTGEAAAAMRENFYQLGPRAAGDMLRQLEAETGDLYPQVVGEVGLTGPLLAATEIIDPVARTTLLNAAELEREKAGVVRASVPKEVATEIDNQIEEALTDYIGTFTAAEDGLLVANQMVDAAKLIAYSMQSTVGPDAAVEMAAAAITSQIDIVVSDGDYHARAPKGLGEKMAAVSLDVRDELTFDQLMPLSDFFNIYGLIDVETATVAYARAGMWVTSPNGDGWVLVDDQRGQPIFDRQGNYITLTYEEAQARDVSAFRQARQIIGAD